MYILCIIAHILHNQILLCTEPPVFAWWPAPKWSSRAVPDRTLEWCTRDASMGHTQHVSTAHYHNILQYTPIYYINSTQNITQRFSTYRATPLRNEFESSWVKHLWRTSCIKLCPEILNQSDCLTVPTKKKSGSSLFFSRNCLEAFSTLMCMTWNQCLRLQYWANKKYEI